jgi:6-phosphofructokinase 1
MGAKAIEVLIEGKTSRVIGIKDNKIIDQDIDEALDIESVFDQELYDIAQVLS